MEAARFTRSPWGRTARPPLLRPHGLVERDRRPWERVATAAVTASLLVLAIVELAR
jgi:hypothetical protein